METSQSYKECNIINMSVSVSCTQERRIFVCAFVRYTYDFRGFPSDRQFIAFAINSFLHEEKNINNSALLSTSCYNKLYMYIYIYLIYIYVYIVFYFTTLIVSFLFLPLFLSSYAKLSTPTGSSSIRKFRVWSMYETFYNI